MTNSIKQYLYILMLMILPAAKSLAMLSPTLEENFESQLFMLLKHWAQGTGLPSDVVNEISKKVRVLVIRDALQRGDYIFEREILKGSGIGDFHFSPDSSLIVADGVVRCARDGEEKHRFSGSKHRFSPDGKLIASSDSDNIKLSIWNLKDENLLETFQCGDYIRDFAFLHNNAFIFIICFKQFFVGKLKPANLEKLDDIEHIFSLAISPDDKSIALGLENDIQLWDVASLKRRSVFRHGDYMGRSALALSSDAKELWLIKMNSITTWDVEKNQNTRSIKLDSLDQGGIQFKRGLAFASECRLMARSSWEVGESPALIEIYNEASGQILNTLRKEGLKVTGIALSPDGHRLALMINLQGFQIWVLRPLLAKTMMKQGA